MNQEMTLADLVAMPMPRKTAPLKAYCTSQSCCRVWKDGKASFSPSIERSVQKGAVNCPECKHALVWARDPEQVA